MNQLTENQIKWISDFTEAQFYAVVYKYIETVLGFSDYVKTDGPWDGGNDLRVFINNQKLKVAFQVTVQEKNLEKKLREDLGKTVENVKTYGYQTTLFFFYSQPPPLLVLSPTNFFTIIPIP